MAAPRDRASGPKVWKVSGAMGGIAGAAAIPYSLDGGDAWKIGLLCGLAGVCLLVAALSCPRIADRFWIAIARRVAPRLEGVVEEDATRGCARHLMTELGTIDRTVEEAIDNGQIWNVMFEGLPADAWRESADMLVRGAPRVHDAVAPVYVEADQLNKLANRLAGDYSVEWHRPSTEEVLGRLRQFRTMLAEARRVLQEHAG